MINGYAAGHTFTHGICACGVRLTDIQWTTHADVGKPNIAHSGNLVGHEVDQIAVLVKTMHNQVNNAFGWR